MLNVNLPPKFIIILSVYFPEDRVAKYTCRSNKLCNKLISSSKSKNMEIKRFRGSKCGLLVQNLECLAL